MAHQFFDSQPTSQRFGHSLNGFCFAYPPAKENKFFPTRAELEVSWSPKTKALVMASPGNPTGLMIDKTQLKDVISWCKEKKVLLIFDELYERLVFGNTPHVCALSLVSEEESEWVVSVNAFSKTFGMTGWRLGWIAGHPKNIERLSDLQSQVLTCMPGFAQVAAAKAMHKMDTIVAPMIEAFGKRKNIIVEGLSGIEGLEVLAHEGAFYVLVNVKGVMQRKGIKDDKAFVQGLLDEQGVVTVSGSSFGAPDCFRISFAMSEEEIKKGLERIRAFCK